MRHAIAATLLVTALPLAACSSGNADNSPDTPPVIVETAATPATPQPLALGKPGQTTGNDGIGTLDITPVTIAYLKQATTLKPGRGLFAVITIKRQSTSAVPAAEPPPISGGGWKWVAPDGQSLDAGNGDSSSVVPSSFNSAGEVQPGTFVWDSRAFDLTEQQRGGTLTYIDGLGARHRWTMPAQDAGPQVVQLKKELAPQSE